MDYDTAFGTFKLSDFSKDESRFRSTGHSVLHHCEGMTAGHPFQLSLLRHACFRLSSHFLADDSRIDSGVLQYVVEIAVVKLINMSEIGPLERSGTFPSRPSVRVFLDWRFEDASDVVFFTTLGAFLTLESSRMR